jgi:hypothetical protein
MLPLGTLASVLKLVWPSEELAVALKPSSKLIDLVGVLPPMLIVPLEARVI